MERLGSEVEFPKNQVCCGQLAYSTGYVQESKDAMKKMRAAFFDSEYIVSLSSSCSYMLQEYPVIFQGDLICLVKNKGNDDLVTALPKTQITVMRMGRLVPTFEELEMLVGL